MKKALTDQRYELIKAHILNPDESPLSIANQEQMNRLVSASKILDKNPIAKQAVRIHLKKFPDVSRRQAYEDVRMAIKLFNTFHTFDYEFWHTWLINDIVSNITRVRENTRIDLVKASHVIATEHANLIKALGEKPKDIEDPKRLEKNAFYILIQNNKTEVKIDVDNLHKLPEATLRELNKVLFVGNDITEADAIEIMGT